MKLYVFSVKEHNDYIDYFKTSASDANEFKEQLDEMGEDYHTSQYDSIYTYIKNSPMWNDDNCSDGEMLDEIMNFILRLGL
jgi:hypothetical protein